MQKKTILILTVWLTIIPLAKTQTLVLTGPSPEIEKAKYPGDDLVKSLSQKINYPIQGLRDKIQGDVVISFIINKNGKMELPRIIESPDNSFSIASIIALNSIANTWSPARINDSPVDKEYQIVIRFRIYYDSKPVDYRGQAKRLTEKQKYDRALKIYNSAIDENQYDYSLFELRSKVKELSGDTAGAKKDQKTARKKYDDIMAVIEISVTATVRVQQTIVRTEVIRR
jgi:hypothetical protein